MVETITSIFVGREKNPSDDILEKLWGLGYAPDELAHSVLAVLVACSVELSQAIVNVGTITSTRTGRVTCKIS